MTSDDSIAQSSKPTSTSRAEFSCLPDEVIRLIAILIPRSYYSPRWLKSLATANKRFYNICRPLLWERLEFPLKMPHSVSGLTKIILPKHGRYVLSIRSDSSNKWFESPSNSLESAPVAPDTRPSRSTDSNRSTSQRGHLNLENVIDILSYCPNLQIFEVYFDETDPLWWLQPVSQRCEPWIALLRGLVQNLAQLQSLRHLRLSFGGQICMPARSVAEILSELPLLESLELWCIARENHGEEGNGMNLLGRAISSLKHLAKLYLYEVPCLKATWPPCLTLEDLTMINCHDSGPLDAPRFVNTFAPNLHRLALEYYGDAARATPAEDIADLKPHHLFHLPRLVDIRALYDTSECQLNNCFQNCANLRHIYYHVSLPKRFSSFVDLVCGSFWPQLETLHLRYCAAGHDDQYDEYSNQLRSFCRTQDIKLDLHT